MELQLSIHVRGHGLGQRMMQIMESAGRSVGMQRSMLTVFKSNQEAFRFYKRIGYDIDAISPSRTMSEKRAARMSYEILSKKL